MTLLDTGPLVALLNARDAHHAWATGLAGRLGAPFFTCEAVLSETHFLLSRERNGPHQLRAFLAKARLDVSFSFQEHRTRVLSLLERYEDVPMAFADACLVCMAEQHDRARVFTTDRDFLIYRKHRSQKLPVLLPDLPLP